MARPSILDRFRPVGAPGPAGPVGVPSQDDQGTAAELLPVFAALNDEIQTGTERIEEAQALAEAEVATAREQAAALLSRARHDAGAERARVAALVEAEAATRDALLREQALQEADTMKEAGRARLPATVRQAIEALLALKNTEQP